MRRSLKARNGFRWEYRQARIALTKVAGSSLQLCGETGLKVGSGSLAPEPSPQPEGCEDTEENEPESETQKGDDPSVA